METVSTLKIEPLGKNSKIIAEIKALRINKNIKSLGRFIIEGKKAVYETLADVNFSRNIEYIILSEEINTEYIQKISFINSIKYVKIYNIAYQLFKNISGDENPEGALCVARIPEQNITGVLTGREKRIFILLDSINDPGNLGTIIRTADNFNVSGVFTGKNSVFEYSSKVIKSSMGSFKNIASAGMNDEIYAVIRKEIQNAKTAAIFTDVNSGITPAQAAALALKNRAEKIFIIGGSESHGLISAEFKELRRAAARPIISAIPNYGGNESLNLAVAMGIYCYETAKVFYGKS